MSGMIPGVGVPRRRRISNRVNSDHSPESYFLGDRSNDSSMNLSETVLRARQRLEKKLSSCLPISPRSNYNMGTKPNRFEENGSSSSKLVNIRRSLKFSSTNKVNGPDSDVCSFCC